MILDIPYMWNDVNDIIISHEGEYLTYDEYLAIRPTIPNSDVTMCLTDMWAGAETLQYLLDVYNGVDVRKKESNRYNN